MTTPRRPFGTPAGPADPPAPPHAGSLPSIPYPMVRPGPGRLTGDSSPTAPPEAHPDGPGRGPVVRFQATAASGGAGAARFDAAGGLAEGLVQWVQRRLTAAGPVAADAGGLRVAVARALHEEGILLPAASFAATVRAIGDELAGLGPLAPLLADPTVTDVLVNGPADVWVERDGRIERAPVRFPSAAAVAALSSGSSPRSGSGSTRPDPGSTPGCGRGAVPCRPPPARPRRARGDDPCLRQAPARSPRPDRTGRPRSGHRPAARGDGRRRGRHRRLRGDRDRQDDAGQLLRMPPAFSLGGGTNETNDDDTPAAPSRSSWSDPTGPASRSTSTPATRSSPPTKRTTTPTTTDPWGGLAARVAASPPPCAAGGAAMLAGADLAD
jgi:hypothetical protein